jgi:hypothetical protein
VTLIIFCNGPRTVIITPKIQQKVVEEAKVVEEEVVAAAAVAKAVTREKKITFDRKVPDSRADPIPKPPQYPAARPPRFFVFYETQFLSKSFLAQFKA